MALTKKIIIDWSETGKTVYAIIRKESNGYMLNNDTGSFSNNPANKYIQLTENASIPSRYELSESRSVWDDGHYTIALYKYEDSAYSSIGSGELYIKSDTEVLIDDFVSLTAKETTLNRALGLILENHVEDDITRDGSGQKTSSKLYLYDSKANALAHDKNTGLVASYSVSVSYDIDNNVSLLKVVKD